VILSNVPEYNSANPDPMNGYVKGFGFMRRWGGSLNSPSNAGLWNPLGLTASCPDYHNHHPSGTIGLYPDVFVYLVDANNDGKQEAIVRDLAGTIVYDGRNHRLANANDYLKALDWLTDFALCTAAQSEAYPKIMAFVNLAVDHQVKAVVNPVAGATMILHANSCFANTEAGCVITNPVEFCATHNCRDPFRVDVFGNLVDLDAPENPDGAVTINQWLTNYAGLPPVYRTPESPKYLNPPANVNQFFLYDTRLDRDYYLSGGLYTETWGATTRNLFFAMALPVVTRPTETEEAAFNRHWSRLNKDHVPPSPFTYYPNHCLSGTSHVVRVEPDILGVKTWLTFVFQKGGYRPAVNGEYWYCGQ
jgi:hypothetical protein